jgi:hypothetical protein
LRQEIQRITGMEVREATAEIEPASGAVVQAFTPGTVVQVFLLAGSTATESWSGSEPGHAEDQLDHDGQRSGNHEAIPEVTVATLKEKPGA